MRDCTNKLALISCLETVIYLPKRDTRARLELAEQ